LELKPGDVVVYNALPHEGYSKDYKEARIGVIQTRSEETSLSGYEMYYTIAFPNERTSQIRIKAEQVISKLLVEVLT
jgi:hypothetical protein